MLGYRVYGEFAFTFDFLTFDIKTRFRVIHTYTLHVHLALYIMYIYQKSRNFFGI